MRVKLDTSFAEFIFQMLIGVFLMFALTAAIYGAYYVVAQVISVFQALMGYNVA